MGNSSISDLINQRQRYLMEVQRQSTENLAGAGNPNYTGKEVSSFEDVLKKQGTPHGQSGPRVTHPNHIRLNYQSSLEGVTTRKYPGEGKVNPREEMLTIGAAQKEVVMNTHITTNLRKLQKIAIGKE